MNNTLNRNELDTVKRLTIDQFRREYYAAGARPSRATVKRWATVGTSEGVILRAVMQDGRLFVRRTDADAFFSACELRPPRPASEIAARAERHAAAIEKLRKMGVI